MATEIIIPKLGMTMEEGKLAEWLVPDGAEVQPGRPVFRLETEKIEMEVEAEAAGTVRHVAPAGATLPPGAVVGYVLAPGEPLPEAVSPATAAAPATPAPRPPAPAPTSTGDGDRIPASPAARRLAREAGLDLAAIAGTGPGGRITESDVLSARGRPTAPPPPAATAVHAAGVAASPIARRLAAELGIDLGTVSGTGPGGRITREDVEAAAASATAPAAAPATVPPTPRPGEVIPLRAMRRTIARRMHASLQEMAQLTMGMDVTMDEAIRLREQLVAEWQSEGVRPTYTDLVVRAVARALRLHPRLNASITDDEIHLAADVNVGLAVALDDGLVVPVIHNADTLSVRELAIASSRLAESARTGALGPDDFAGATFSVTSLGPSGVHFFTPIINPPNVAILGIGAIRDATTWDGDTPRRTRNMTLSLTIDHRAVDGAPGAAFLATVRDLLQAPYRLLL